MAVAPIEESPSIHDTHNLSALRNDYSPYTTGFPWREFHGADFNRGKVQHAYIVAFDESYLLEFKPDTEWDESQSVLHCVRGPDATLVEAIIDLRYCLWEASKNIVERSYTVARVVEVDLKKVDGCIINLSTVSSAQAAGLGIKSAETPALKSAIALSHVTATALTGRKWCVDAVAAREQRDQRKVANILGTYVRTTHSGTVIP